MADLGEARREAILTKPLLPLLIKTAVPTMVGMMVSMIYNLTDTFCIGFLGNKSMTASIGIVFAFVSLIQALGFWFGYGSGNIMSRLIGAKQEEEAKCIASCGALLSLLCSVGVMILSFVWKQPMIKLLGGDASGDLHFFTEQYLNIMLFTVPFSMYATTVYNQIRLCGNVRDAMIGLLVGMAVNILLDPVFILVFGMEIRGAGYATLIGNICGALVIYHFTKIHGNISASLSKARLTKNRIYHILAGGAPNFSRQSITSIATVLLNHSAAFYGETLIAAMTVSTKVVSLSCLLMIGFGQGFQPICAMNYGAKQYDRVKKVLKLTLCIGTSFLVIAAVMTAIWAEPLSGLLSQNDDVIQLAAVLVRFQCVSMPLMGIYALSSMFLQNVHRYFQALLISIARQGLFYIPLLFLLHWLFGAFGLYILQPVSDVVSTVFAVILVRASWKQIFSET